MIRSLAMAEEKEQEKVELSPKEVMASKLGWKPQDKWEGPEEDWRSASVFLEHRELMDRISSQTRDLKELKKVIKDFKEHSKKRDKIALEKAKEELLAAKAEAMEKEDYNTVVQIDEDIKDADKEIESFDKEEPNEKSGEDEFKQYFEKEWIENNSWYNQWTSMRRDADQLGSEFFKKDPEISPKDLFEKVTKQIMKEYPDRFKNPDRERGDGVGNGKGHPSTRRQPKLDLTEEEYKCGSAFVRQGLYKDLHEYQKALREG
jgi:hypothetical protein